MKHGYERDTYADARHIGLARPGKQQAKLGPACRDGQVEIFLREGIHVRLVKLQQGRVEVQPGRDGCIPAQRERAEEEVGDGRDAGSARAFQDALKKRSRRIAVVFKPHVGKRGEC